MTIDHRVCPSNHRCPMISQCPVDAISQKAWNKTPVINEEKCISCGICAGLCPFGAVR